MKTIIFGSCRVKRFRAHIKQVDVKKSIYVCQHHLHNPYEIYQLLNWIVNEKIDSLVEFSKYHNEISTRTKGVSDNYYQDLIENYKNADRVIIEISSIKRLTIGFDLNLFDSNLTSISFLKKNEPEALKDLQESLPSIETFIEAIKNIKKIIGTKKLVVVPHYSWSTKDGPLRSRELLRSHLLTSANLLNFDLFDPDDFLLKFNDKSIVCLDSSHYTPRFERLIARFFEKKMN